MVQSPLYFLSVFPVIIETSIHLKLNQFLLLSDSPTCLRRKRCLLLFSDVLQR